MRISLAPAIALVLLVAAAGCGKKTEASPTPTEVRRGESDPVACRGMRSADDCTKCCDPRFWSAVFNAGKCACVKK